MKNKTILELFRADHLRAERYHLQLPGLYVDFSKNHLDEQLWQRQIERLEKAQWSTKLEALFNGELLNSTEQRAALHTALRQQNDLPIFVDGKNIIPEIRKTQKKMRDISEAIREHRFLGFTEKPIIDIVNIGIGGSDLGPVFVTEALASLATPDINLHFISNIDAYPLAKLLKKLNPETTLFIIASKSFTTQETLLNANSCRAWLLNTLKKEAAISRHFLATTANPTKALDYGIPANNILPFWEWVGGRYSLWSAIGLPIAIAIGMDLFEAFLAGAAAIDQHVRKERAENNLPVRLALISDYYINQYQTQTQAVIPYDERLAKLPHYLQQLDMESNGKSVDNSGNSVRHNTAPIIWGGVGTNSQHASHQLLHQGTVISPVDFILCKKSMHDFPEHHPFLIAHCLAQAEALMIGKTEEQAYQELCEQGIEESRAQDLAKHRKIIGNKASNVIILDELTPYNLGLLIALYEHKIFIQSVLWNINPFDQWGVELGKQLSSRIAASLKEKQTHQKHDPSTTRLIDYFNH